MSTQDKGGQRGTLGSSRSPHHSIFACVLRSSVLRQRTRPAYADFVFLSCGPSAGSTYYMEGGMVSAANAGWQKDGIDAGIQLLIKGDKTFDLFSKGPLPNDFKYSDHGCEFGTVSLSPDKNELVVFAHCPNQKEVFFFNWKDDKTGGPQGQTVRGPILSAAHIRSKLKPDRHRPPLRVMTRTETDRRPIEPQSHQAGQQASRSSSYSPHRLAGFSSCGC
jgi:hypothetical protein